MFLVSFYLPWCCSPYNLILFLSFTGNFLVKIIQLYTIPLFSSLRKALRNPVFMRLSRLKCAVFIHYFAHFYFPQLIILKVTLIRTNNFEALAKNCEVTPNEWSVSGMNAVKHCRNDRGVKYFFILLAWCSTSFLPHNLTFICHHFTICSLCFTACSFYLIVCWYFLLGSDWHFTIIFSKMPIRPQNIFQLLKEVCTLT